MANVQLDKFLKALEKEYQIHAPVKNGQELYICPISDLKDVDWSGDKPANTWKQIFHPAGEKLFDYDEKGRPQRPVVVPNKIAALGMNILDLKALVLYDQVFEKDAYYQKRRRSRLVIGYFKGSPIDYRSYKVHAFDFEENILEHLSFDVFIQKDKAGKIRFFSGSRMGQRILEKYGVGKYEHIEFAGCVPEGGPHKNLLELGDKVVKSKGKKVWKDLDKRCLACGRCALACPACFCFNNVDAIDQAGKKKDRQWTTCFSYDFSRIAGADEDGIHFLQSIEDRIFFW